MKLPAVAVGNRLITGFCSFLLFFAGVGSYYALGQLEDPEFTVKSASVVTNYPGASPEEVEQEVT
ncbi:MAG: efflux RND transporter permease subunit, partial [Chlamydiia bacterium]|nr:efflux RND transporter permease subunit [Chlamydiia bacterium]